MISIYISAVWTDALTDEIALYDRQIRLWGVQAQERYMACLLNAGVV